MLAGTVVGLEDAGFGIYEGVAAAGAGEDYWFALDDQRFPDPYSRWQPEGLRGPSRVVSLPPRSDGFTTRNCPGW